MTRLDVAELGSSYYSRGPPCTSTRGMCSTTRTSARLAAMVAVAVSINPLGVHTPETKAIACTVPAAATQHRASQSLETTVLGADSTHTPPAPSAH